VSELKCCKRCGAFYTCTHKGQCCPECQWYDPTDNLCLALPERKKAKRREVGDEEEPELDPETYLFEDDDEEEEDLGISDDEDFDEDEDLDMEDDEW
jgi:hypothetical protein